MSAHKGPSNTGQRPMSKNIVAPSRLPSNSNGNAALPALLDQCQQIDRVLTKVGSVDRELLDATWSGTWFDIARARATLAAARRLQDAWLAVNRPATPAEVSELITLQIACYPNLKLSDGQRQVFTHKLVQLVIAARPSLHVLQAALDRMLVTNEFFSIAELMQALAQERQRARYLRQLADQVPSLQRSLDSYAAGLPGLLIEQEAEAGARTRKRLRRRLECSCGWPPTSRYGDYEVADLQHRLGLSFDELQELARDEVLARLDAAEQNAESDDE
jgi:hypothetical protein